MARTSITFLASACLALTAGAAAADETMYGGIGNDTSAGSKGALVTIDQTTGHGTVVGTPVPGLALTGLAFDASGDLFASTIGGFSTTGTLVRLDPVTGNVLATIGPITEGGTPISIGDLSFQPGTDLLYGLRSNADPAKLGGRLYTIDVVTGVASLIGNTGSPNGGGIAFAPDGTLYMTTQDAAHTNFLDTVDPGTAAVITSVHDGLFFDSLGIRGDGILFASDGNDTIYNIDPATGAATLIGLTGTGHPSDIDFLPRAVPEPGSLGMLCLGGLMLMASRRARRPGGGA